MKYSDFSIELLINQLTELFNKKSTPKRTAALALEAIEVIRQLQKKDKSDSPTGYWQWWEETISTPDAREYEYGWRCSRCETEPPGIWDDPFEAPEFLYCPFCGKKMDNSIAKAQVEDHIETAKKRIGE